jgi:RNA polymerase sigma-70 factor (ECF subfamily)
LAALPLAQREAFLLHQEGGLTAIAVARATGTHEEAAKSRLRYAVRKLKEAIDDE